MKPIEMNTIHNTVMYTENILLPLNPDFDILKVLESILLEVACLTPLVTLIVRRDDHNILIHFS